jgi:iron complex transport system permease protein
MTRPAAVTARFAAAYLVLAMVGTWWGSVSIPPARVARIMASVVAPSVAESIPPTDRFLVLHIRVPQLLLLGLVGAALSGSGAALQATFENPLADPSVLGVSGGAAFGAVLAIHTGLAEHVFLALPACAFAGGLCASLLVYSLTYVGGRPTSHTLLLTGVAVGSISVAGVSLVMILTEVHRVQELMFWLVGGVRNQTWEHVAIAALPITIGTFGLIVLHRRLDALLLGEEQALAVGVPVARTRVLILLLTSLATGSATAVSGTIGFVGLMVPHFVRRLTGPRAIDLFPGCIVGGAAFLTACELLSRALSEQFALHLGILTSLLGGPTFLFLLRRSERERE